MSINNIKVFQDSGKVDVRLVERFERQFGVVFPEQYKKFICEHNAAYLDNEYFDFFSPEQGVIDTSSICFLGFGSAEGLVIESEDVINNQNYDVYGYDNVITFGRNGGGDYICFDYRGSEKQGQPKVIFMRHDDYDDTNKMITFDVSDSFDDFCNLLYEWEDE
jgi:hypothetical protein